MASRLDFELEDSLLDASVPEKQRKKVIGLDDLLTDHFKDKGRHIEGEPKKKKARKNDSSDDEDNTREATLSTALDEYHKQMQDMGGDDDISHWGLCVFGTQKSLPDLHFPQLQSCKLLESFCDEELNSLVGLDRGEENTFLEGLLVNGWLSKLIAKQNHVEAVVAKWTFHLMMFSSKRELRKSACEFWSGILSLKSEDNTSSIKIHWVPRYSGLKGALDIYGYTSSLSSNSNPSDADSELVGPSENIHSWIKFVTATCQVRSKMPLFSDSEVEELIEIMISFSLDRRLEGLSALLHNCMSATINYVTDEQWNFSCGKIAKSLASRVPRDLNCLRAVECISGVDPRSKSLRSKVAHQMLTDSPDVMAGSDEEILDKLISIKVKEKSCDLFKVYIYLSLTENWLLWGSKLEDKPVIKEMWGVFLRNCSCLIASTDLRSYASKVRNRASYLLHGSIHL